MPRTDYKRCRKCGASSEDVGPLSHTRQCSACGEATLIANVRELHGRSGDALERWRRGMALSVGALLLDDVVDLLQTAEQADA